MRSTMRALLAVVLSIRGIVAFGPSQARAQMAMPSSNRSLGGYGASTLSSYSGGGNGGYLPYNGRASGFVPYAGSYGGGLGVQPIPRRLPQTSIGGAMMAETPIGGSSLSGGMGGAARGGMGMGSRSGSRTLVPFGYEGGIGVGSGMIGTPMTKRSGMRRSAPGPGFGYPFRMPPDLTTGSSMSMP